MSKMLDGNTVALERYQNQEEEQERAQEIREETVREIAEEFFTSLIYRSDDLIGEAMGADNLTDTDYKMLGEYALYARSSAGADFHPDYYYAKFGRYLLDRMADYAMPECRKMAESKVSE